jgi:hypothetical protein
VENLNGKRHQDWQATQEAMSNPFVNWSQEDVASYNARSNKSMTFQEADKTLEIKDNDAREEQMESTLHYRIIAECKKRGWYYVHSRMDRRTTQAKGVPDFIIAAHGKTYWIEAKALGKKLRPEQLGAIQWLTSLNHTAACVWSMEDFFKVIE